MTRSFLFGLLTFSLFIFGAPRAAAHVSPTLAFTTRTAVDTVGTTPAVDPTRYTTAQRSADLFARTIVGRLDTLLKDPLFDRSQVGICVYDLTDDRTLYAHGLHQRLRPASNMKVITAVAALDLLGADYRFATTLQASGEPDDSGRVSNVYIRGGMDPLFAHDDLRSIVEELRRHGVRKIVGDVVLDATMKDTATLGRGWCWDDKARPLTPLLYRRGNKLSDNLLRALSQAGITVGGFVRTGVAPTAAPVWLARTHTIDQVLRPMMKESDNLCAESMFFQMAALSRRPYANYRDAVAQMSKLITRWNVSPDEYQIVDGSGLSLYNYLTPELLVLSLRYAYRNGEIYQHLYAALPIMGRDGTLRTRNRNTPAQDNVRAKTGSVEGVSSLSGYALAANGHQLCFSIINQGVRNMAEGRRFQDRVCRALTDGLSTPHIRPDEISEPAPSSVNQPAGEENGPDDSDGD
mgnify:FL=1